MAKKPVKPEAPGRVNVSKLNLPLGPPPVKPGSRLIDKRYKPR